MTFLLSVAPPVALFAVLGLLFQSYRDDKPAWLLDFKAFSAKLKGYWTPLFLLVAPLAFAYNTVATAVYAVMVLFEWMIAFVRWLLGIVLWIWNKGFMWYWRNVIVVPVVLIAKVVWHYLIVWPWRIYKTVYHTIRDSFSREGMRIGWWTTTLVASLVGIGYWLASWFEMDLFLFLGILLAEVPYLWGMGVLASMKDTGDVQGKKRADHHGVGIASAKTGMKYVGAAAAVLLVIYLVAYSGAIPAAGYPLMGLLINAAHAAGILGIGVCLVLFLSLAVLPTYILDKHDNGPLDEMLTLIRMGRDNVLKVLLAGLPVSLFSVFVGLVPVAVVGCAFFGVTALKEKALGNMAGVVAEEAASIDATVSDLNSDFAKWSEAVKAKPDVECRQAQIEYMTAFPLNLIDEGTSAMQGVQTVDYSAMKDSMERAFADREAIRIARVADLEGEIGELDQQISLEMDERSTYTVERSMDDGESWSVVANGVERSGFVDTGLESGSAYRYRVTANNRKGSSGPGNVAMASTRSTEITGPSGVSARAEGNFRIVLNWNDNDWNEEGFKVERSNDGEEWSQVANLDANSTFWVDESVTDTTYQYRVTSFRGEDLSDPVRTYRSAQPSLPAPYSSILESNSSSALVVWSHNANYRSAERGGEAKDGEGAALSYDGLSRLEELQQARSMRVGERDQILTDAADDTDYVMPRVTLLGSLPAQEDASRAMRILTFLLGMLALALLAGCALCTIIAYSGMVTQDVVRLTDGDQFYFVEEVRAVRKAHDNQPLLGFLLLGLTGVPMANLLSGLVLGMLGALMAFTSPFGLSMPDIDFDIETEWSTGELFGAVSAGDIGDDMEMTGDGTVEGEEDEMPSMREYVIQGGTTVWREITNEFGATQYDLIRAANGHLSDNEWKGLKAGAVIALPADN